jgi:superfamily I DNA and RNA helicase
MKKYFGLGLYMGIVQLPEHSMYWNKDNCGQDFVKNLSLIIAF